MLPKHLFEEPSRLLSDLQVGESACVLNWDMSVMADGTCWLNPEAKLYPVKETFFKVLVERRPDGFHVQIPKHDIGGYRWMPETCERKTNLLPVASLES